MGNKLGAIYPIGVYDTANQRAWLPEVSSPDGKNQSHRLWAMRRTLGFGVGSTIRIAETFRVSSG